MSNIKYTEMLVEKNQTAPTLHTTQRKVPICAIASRQGPQIDHDLYRPAFSGGSCQLTRRSARIRSLNAVFKHPPHSTYLSLHSRTHHGEKDFVDLAERFVEIASANQNCCDDNFVTTI